MKKIQIIKNNDDRAEREPLINIITRTAGRPNFFDNNYNSICNQNYSNYKHWVIYDEQKTYKDYLRYYHDIELVKVDKQEVQQRDDIKHPNTGGRFFYNLYFNDAISQIKDGWILILDDDDALAHPNVLKKIANLLKYKSDMAIFQMKYLSGKLLPDASYFYKKPMLGSIGSPCVVVHHKYAKMHKWDGWKCADFRYINACWKNTSRKVWIKEPMISIGSMNGNFGKKNDIKTTVKKKERVDLIFAIPTYNRVKYLKSLLEKLSKANENIKYVIYVIDDNSKNHHENKKNALQYSNLTIQKNGSNNGKIKYWQTFNMMLNFAKKYHFNHFVQVDDDFDLCEGFVDKIYNLSINNENNFVRYIKTHHKKNRWNTVHWVDGGTMIPYSFLRKINFNIDPIPLTRWSVNKHLSSGVWQQITNKILKYGYKTIHLNYSLVKHLGYKESRMNPEIRKKENIKVINFVDEKK